nr:MAG TPA: hypothetical protein [Caudoviricetes sp.]
MMGVGVILRLFVLLQQSVTKLQLVFVQTDNCYSDSLVIQYS